MRRVSVTSSVIASVGYSPEHHQLEVEFRTGAVYEYVGVPPDVHERLMAAESVGRFFNMEVRDTYPCRRLE